MLYDPKDVDRVNRFIKDFKFSADYFPDIVRISQYCGITDRQARIVTRILSREKKITISDSQGHIQIMSIVGENRK